MQIKSDGLFFKFLSLYDGDVWNLDSCKIVKLCVRNLVGCLLSVALFFVLGFVLISGAIYPFLLMFGPATLLAPYIAFSIITYGVLIILAFQPYKGKLKESKVAQLYDSWKNKYCLKVEVVQ